MIGVGEHASGTDGRREADAVFVWIKVGETVEAVAVGGGGADGSAAVVVECDSDALDTGFARVLAAIAIEVFPDVVTQGCLW